jgi:adenylate cyclase
LGVDVLIIAALGALAPLATLRLRGRVAALVPILAGVVYVGASQLLFDAGWILPITTPLIALVLGLIAALAVERIAAAFERARVYDLFSRFVPDTVVKEVVAQAHGARLGGVARVCTVMFADLRGFTSFSSTQEPQLVIDVVNAYLGEMSEAILEAGGTLVAYLGDGILAVFGAPLEQPDHADRALAAALEMITRRLPRFNAQLRSMGLEAHFDMGIGLNSGSVISGNVGSERRLEYTTIGDTTNLASRIEGATKDTSHMLLFSDSTRQSLTRPPATMPLGDEIELRGANRPLRLWTVPGTERAGGPGATAGSVDGGVAEDASSEDGAGRASVAFVDGAGLSDR